jgi:hypothetical protein
LDSQHEGNSDEECLGGQEEFGKSVPERCANDEAYLDGEDKFVTGEASVQDEDDEGYLGGQEGDEESGGIGSPVYDCAGWGTHDGEDIDEGIRSDGCNTQKNAAVHLGD